MVTTIPNLQLHNYLIIGSSGFFFFEKCRKSQICKCLISITKTDIFFILCKNSLDATNNNNVISTFFPTNQSFRILFCCGRNRRSWMMAFFELQFLEWPAAESRVWMESSIPPFAEIDSSEDSTLARNSGIDLVIRQDHGVDLHAVHIVTVVT